MKKTETAFLIALVYLMLLTALNHIGQLQKIEYCNKQINDTQRTDHNRVPLWEYMKYGAYLEITLNWQ